MMKSIAIKKSRITKQCSKSDRVMYLAYCKEVPKRFGHFLRVNSDKAIVDPVPYIAFFTCSTALSNFILMVGKHKVHSSTMNVKRVTQISSTHGTTLNMPPRSSKTPWALPRWLSFLCSLQNYIITTNKF